MSKHKSTIKATIKCICLVKFSRTFLWKIFCKLIPKNLWWSSFFLKHHALSILLWTTLDGCVWSMKIFLWEAFFQRLQKFCCRNCQWKYIENENHKFYLGNKEEKLIFLVVSWLDAHFSFGSLFLRGQPGTQVKLRK